LLCSYHAFILSDDPATLAEAQGWIDWFAYYVEPGEDPYQPVMDIFYPIIDDISRVKVAGSDDYNTKNHTVVGVLVATAYWRKILGDVLPSGTNGFVVVVNNTCQKPFTYVLNGPQVDFIGVGNLHDEKYGNLAIKRKITELEEFSISDSVYSGAPINEDFCPYTLYLYPSDEMKSAFVTNKAVTFMMVTLVVFGCLVVAFAIYDFKVERRQKKVLSSAVRSSEIVSSLFPESVQDQLYQTTSNDEKHNLPLWPKNGKLEEINSTQYVVSPIAKLYPDTTVMFADIKGFTEWSAPREPTQVFHLLETLYGGFDKLAKQHGVFKVETIGDTYVAVVGLPTSRKYHAMIMAKFASRCLETMAVLTRQLDETLGSVRFYIVSLPLEMC
jgi:Adenylate and Guanylate cyclase catalytic domain